MHFAKRMGTLKASGIRKLFDRAARMDDAIDLSIGQADFDVPEPIKDATIEAIGHFCGRYSPTGGYPDVVEATRRRLLERGAIDDTDEVMLTSGATGAITLGILALAGPGDEVLLPDPHFVLYPNVVRIVGADPVFYSLTDEFRPDLDAIESAITDRTRLLIINSPSNPTGAVFTEAELQGVADVCRRHGVPVMSDDLYDLFVYDGVHTPIKPMMGAEGLLVGGVSKTYGMAGWRLGWAAGPRELIERMKVLQQFCYTCPPTLVQRGALAAFDIDMSEQVAHFRAKRDLVVRGLRQAGYDVVAPQGSFFVFPRVPWGDDSTFIEAALARNLVLVPGHAFTRGSQHFRISIGAPMEMLERSLPVFEALAEQG